MASLAEQIVLSIQAVVSGQQQVTSLTGNLNGLSQATQNLNGHFLDVNGQLRDAQGRFVAAGGAAGAMAGGFTGAAAGAGRLGLGLLNLNAGLQIVQQVQQAVQNLMDQMGKYAQQADGAAVAARSWQIVLERFNIDANKAEAAMSSLSDRTGASVESLKGAAAQYIKMGGTLEDFERSALAAASSWYDLSQKTITLDDAIGNVTLGVAQGRSELMETAGIVVNASQAWEKYADSLGKSVDDLTDAEKAHAYALAVYKEEQIGIETLADKQTALSRAQNEASKAQREFGVAAGQVVLPVYTQMVRAGTDVTRTVTEIVRAYQQGGDATAALAQKYPALASALERLRPAADQMKAGLLSAWGSIQDVYQRVLLPVFERIAPIAQQVWSRVPSLVSQAGQVIGQVFRTIADLWEHVLLPVWDAVAPAVRVAVDQVARLLGDALTTVKNVFAAVSAALRGDWQGAWDFAVQAVGHALLAVEDVLNGLSGLLIRALQGLNKLIDDKANELADRFRRFGVRVRDSFIEGFAGLAERLATEVGTALEKATSRMPDWAKRLLGITAL